MTSESNEKAKDISVGVGATAEQVTTRLNAIKKYDETEAFKNPQQMQTGNRGLVLRTISEMQAFALYLANSTLVPPDYKGKPNSCLVAIQYGAEIGLLPMQAVQSIAVINGRPCLWGDAPLSLCMASPVFDHSRHDEKAVGTPGSDKYGWECTFARVGGKPKVSTFTVGDAKKAGLWTKAGPWTQYPDRMLLCRARAFGLRNTFPDIIKGMGIREEIVEAFPVEQDRPPISTKVEVLQAASKITNPVSQDSPAEFADVVDTEVITIEAGDSQ
ncbi:hypothetical protein [Nitrospira sp. BLG_1]|uniref:hypothetical protein n=1 Tax=Nitrospira sp. BLG_1 TaxID=3395883 RepID=UPI0039BC280F